MSKLKCAYMYSTQADPLPTRKEAEKKFSTKVLYGFGKHNKPKTPYAKSMYLVESAFPSVSNMFTASQTISTYAAQLVAFDDSIDEVFFTLTAMQNTITKFSVDDQIINDMYDLSWKLGHLERDLKSLQGDISTLSFYLQKAIGDQQFFDFFPKREADIQSYIKEVERMIDIYRTQLKALFSSGW